MLKGAQTLLHQESCGRMYQLSTAKISFHALLTVRIKVLLVKPYAHFVKPMKVCPWTLEVLVVHSQFKRH